MTTLNKALTEARDAANDEARKAYVKAIDKAYACNKAIDKAEARKAYEKAFAEAAKARTEADKADADYSKALAEAQQKD